MSITGTIASDETVPGRASDRLLLKLNARGVTTDGTVTSVLIHNLSLTGLLIETKLPVPLGKRLLVDLPEAGKVGAAVVWQSDRLVGCRFDEPISRAVLSAAQLRNPIQHGLDLDRLVAAAPFGERLRHYREKRGFSRAGLAALTGLSAPTLWSWESGKTQPRRKSLRAVAEALDVPESDLLHGRDTSSPDPELAPGEQSATESPPDLESVLRAHKERIAAALGVDAARVKIVVEI